eukprot:1150093-Pelagomonas_calceolata.AAC.1
MATILAQKGRESPPPQRCELKMLMGILRVTGSTWLHNLAVTSILVFNSTPSGNKLVGIHNRMGMKFASKFIGALVKSQLFKLVKDVLSVAGSTNTQKNGVESHNFCINEFAE